MYFTKLLRYNMENVRMQGKICIFFTRPFFNFSNYQKQLELILSLESEPTAATYVVPKALVVPRSVVNSSSAEKY